MPETMRCLSTKLPVLLPSLWQQHAVWVCFSAADRPLAWVLEEWEPGAGPRLRPGQVRLKVGGGEREPQRVSNGTCVCGTAPPVGPGTEVSHSAAGRGAPAGQWRWPALGGPESAYGPGSLLKLGRPGPEYIYILTSLNPCSIFLILI